MPQFEGAWSYAGGNGMQLGIDTAGSAVDTNSGTFQADYYFYTRNQYSYSGDAQTLNYSGSLGGSDGFTNSSGSGGWVLRAVHSVTHVYTTWGSSPGTFTVNAVLSGAYNGSTPGVSASVAVPARPYAAPIGPGGTTAVRNSDTQATIAWVDQSTAQRPWTSVSVEMTIYSGSSWTPSWIPLATVPYAGMSFAATGRQANRKYYFRVRSNNSVGSSAWQYPGNEIYMTPAAPSNVSSTLGAAGTTIVTTWTNNHYVDPSVTLTVQRSVAGGAYTFVATGLAHTTTTWTDPSPGAGANQYRVYAFQTNGSLVGPSATGNVVSTVVPPLAPTALTPNGIAKDLQFVGATLSWTHNPGADYAFQTHFTIETSIDAGGSWQPLATNVASNAATYTMAPGLFTNGGPAVLWRVQTQGGSTAGFGPFSNPATITPQTTPTVTLDPLLPADPTIQLPLTVSWVYNQDQSSPQAVWVAILYAADGVTVLEFRSEQDATTLVPFEYPVQDGATYVVAVQAMSASGLWTAWVYATTTVDLPLPAPTTLVATYQPCTGTMSITVTTPPPGVGEVATDYVTVRRRVAGGEWVTLATNLNPNTTLLDLIPLTNGLNEYQATGYSGAPSTLLNPIVAVQGTDGQNPSTDGLWVFLAYGPAFATVLRVHSNLTIQDTPGRAQTNQNFLGRRKPSALYGVGISRNVSVGADLRYIDPCPRPDTCRYDSPPNDWIVAAQDAEVVCYRDFTGRRLFASFDGVQISDGYWPGNASLSFKITEVDYSEVTGALPVGGGLTLATFTPPTTGCIDVLDGGGP